MSLKVFNLRKSLPDFEIVADFRIENGERVGLSGPTGSGKSTLLKMIAGLTPTDAGTVSLGSRDLTPLAPEKRDIGFMFQDQALFSHLSILDNLSFGLRMKNTRQVEREQRTQEWVDRLNLGSLLKRSIHQLSGGERQKIALARALISRPDLLLLDEAFSALDALSKKTLLKELLLAFEFIKIPVLIVSHDEEELRELTTRQLKIVSSDNDRLRKVAD